MNCCSYITRLGERMLSMNSTLVETVSINYEDFNESFLTCGTCLCLYDGGEHTPKLLQCSHTVCLHCLSRIAASQTRDTGAFRCPICRELIPIPRGGVSALPPSFLVNQLLDLMSRQRREVIPKCSVHINQELLFCETCDTVFCTQCTAANGGLSAGVHGTSSTSSNGSCEHTVIPFSIAIKRMSEILLYKANECISKLGLAQETVSDELRKLDQCAETCIEYTNHTFDEVIRLAEERRQEVISIIRKVQSNKRSVLEEQLALVEAEKNKVERECDGLQYQVEVRNITQKISSLSEKLDTVGSLGEPRENAFLTCEFKLANDSQEDTHSLSENSELLGAASVDDDKERSLEKLRGLLKNFGRVRTSTTFPGLCSLVLDNMCAGQVNGQEIGAAAPVIACLEASATLYTVDYHGVPRNSGGDPLRVELVQETTSSDSSEGERDRALDVRIKDMGDGTYQLSFRPPAAGTYALKVNVFDRPIKDCPFRFEATEHNNPLRVFGSHGSGKDGFHQPVAVAVDDTCCSQSSCLIYVVDTGNSRIKVLTADLDFVRHVECEDLAGCSCTGVALVRKPDCSKGENGKWSPCNLVLVNWRTKVISEITAEGETVKSFSYPSFVEPVAVAVDSRGHILVADNGTSSVIIFDSEGNVLFVIGGGSKAEDGSDKIISARSQSTSSGSRGIHQRPGTTSAGAVGKAKGRFGLISSVAVGPGDEIIVSDSRIQIFSSSGEFIRDVESYGRGKYGAATVDSEGRLIAIHSEKSRHELQVISLALDRNGSISREPGSDRLLSTVDSHGSRLRRPSGVAVNKDCQAFLVDLGNDCVKKYQYW